jgi:hypothetical protein
MKKWRKMTWALWVWSALIVVWMVGGGGSAASNCATQAGDEFLSAQQAQEACQAGVGLGVAAIALFGFVGFVFLSIIWFMTRPKRRACPRCGDNVKSGVTVCSSCEFDFVTIGTVARAS